MYSKRTNLIIGFHGCDEKVAHDIITKKSQMNKSTNDYDWLGSGMYFWENNYSRALQFAVDQKNRTKHDKVKKVEVPSVIGAVIDLGYCLDLLESENLLMLKSSYETLKELSARQGFVLPQNKTIGKNNDFLIRHLDCAVIENLHQLNKMNNLIPYDSVRGVFWEGEELYENAGFKEKNHIQICVRNPNCIKGFFIPRDIDDNFQMP